MNMKDFLKPNKLTWKILFLLFFVNVLLLLIPMIITSYIDVSRGMGDLLEGIGFLGLFISAPATILTALLFHARGFDLPLIIVAVFIQGVFLYCIAFLISKIIYAGKPS